MVHETPELYEKVVVPYIEAFPPSRTQWCVVMLDAQSLPISRIGSEIS